MQELVKLVGGDAQDRLLLGDAPLLYHLHGDLERGERRALADAGLEHPKLTLLDRELDVHHVGVVVLKDLEDVEELLARLLERGDLHEIGDGLGVADACHDVLTLGVYEKVAVALVGAVGGVTREGDAGGGGVSLVAKDHDLDVDGSAQGVVYLILLAVEHGALRVPRTEDGLLGKA